MEPNPRIELGRKRYEGLLPPRRRAKLERSTEIESAWHGLEGRPVAKTTTALRANSGGRTRGRRLFRWSRLAESCGRGSNSHWLAPRASPSAGWGTAGFRTVKISQSTIFPR